MKTLEKLFKVMMNNVEYTIIMLVAIALFAIFSDGLLAGIITAVSALIAYICIEKIYNEFKKKKK